MEKLDSALISAQLQLLYCYIFEHFFLKNSNFETDSDLYIQEYLEENAEVTFEIFLEKIWDNIHEIYRRPQDETKETDTVTPETPDVSWFSMK